MNRSFCRIISIMMIMIMVMLAVSCGTDRKNGEKQVAKVNDSVITLGDLDTYAILEYYIAGYDPAEISGDEKHACLETMVRCEAIRQYYEEQGRDIYNDEYDSGKNGFLSRMQASSMDYLKENNISEEDLIYYYRNSYLSQILFRDVREEHGEEAIEAAAKAYYDGHLEQYKKDPQEGSAGGEPQYQAFEDVKDSIEYTICSQYYQEKIEQIMEGMEIETAGPEEIGD